MGRLVTDEQFRRDLAIDPARACFERGFELSPRELQALASIPHRALSRFVAQLDDGIRRLDVRVEPRQEKPS